MDRKTNDERRGSPWVRKMVSVLLLAWCTGGCDGEDLRLAYQAPEPVAVGGTATGLRGPVTLRNNGSDDLVVSTDGPFFFHAAVMRGGTYEVTVRDHPPGQVCEVHGGTGVADAEVSSVRVVCAWQVAENLPRLRVTTVGGADITSKEEYLDGEYRVWDEKGHLLAEGALQIRGRGNSTWGYPKKPYRLKFVEKESLLGMPASRHWVLLANYLDKTLLRTEAAFALSEGIGLAWTPRSRQVLLEINDRSLGIYQLTEHVRIAPSRVDIDELDVPDPDPVVVTGGYLMQVDYWRGEDYCRRTPAGAWLCFEDPETLLEPAWEAHRDYIDGYLDATETALYGERFDDPEVGYAVFLDVASAVDFYLVHEVFKNPDSNFFTSIYLFKPRGGKLVFGPVWDFDLAAGNAQWARYGFFDGSNPMGWHTRVQDTRTEDTGTNWYTRLFEDPAFEARVRARWTELREAGVFEDMFTHIERRAAYLSRVQQRNFEKWRVLDTVLQPDLSPVIGPWEAHVSAMVSWLRWRVSWMDGELGEP